MCSTHKPGPSFIDMANERLGRTLPEPIVNADPGDETDHVDGLDMPSDELIFLGHDDRLTLLEASSGDLYGRTDRLAGALANLALRVAEMRAKRSRRQRFKAWFGDTVYRGPQ